MAICLGIYPTFSDKPTSFPKFFGGWGGIMTKMWKSSTEMAEQIGWLKPGLLSTKVFGGNFHIQVGNFGKPGPKYTKHQRMPKQHPNETSEKRREKNPSTRPIFMPWSSPSTP